MRAAGLGRLRVVAPLHNEVIRPPTKTLQPLGRPETSPGGFARRYGGNGRHDLAGRTARLAEGMSLGCIGERDYGLDVGVAGSRSELQRRLPSWATISVVPHSPRACGGRSSAAGWTPNESSEQRDRDVRHLVNSPEASLVALHDPAL